MALIGLKNLYYAVMTSDTSEGATYEGPVKIGNAVSVDINPTVNKVQLYGDDMAVAANTSLGEITVTIESTEISLEHQAVLLGAELGATSDTLMAKSSNSAPYVMLMFESETHEGKNRCVKLLKGKFSPTQETINTRGGSLEYQTAKLAGSFVARQYDGGWKLVKDFAKGASTADWYTTDTTLTKL